MKYGFSIILLVFAVIIFLRDLKTSPTGEMQNILIRNNRDW
jgi:hypothetical protein